MACANDTHTVFLSDDGVVHSFGVNFEGELGLGHNDSVSLPTPISILPKIMEISCGYQFTVCVDKEGGLWSFGENCNGKLGTGNTTNYNIPQKIEDIPPVCSVSCGSHHTLVITTDSNLWSCGRNDFGQLCLGNTEHQAKYQQTSFSNISKICAGGFHSYFQNNGGEIFGCGHNYDGQIGLGHFNHPQIIATQIPNLPLNIVQFCSGYSHSLFLDSEGNVFSLGNNEFGNLGLGHNIKQQNVLNQIPNIPPIRTISCVGHSNYLIDLEGNLWSFGCNAYGQLGHGDETNRNVPTKITALRNITQILRGFGDYFLAKDSQNKIFIMGWNEYGMLDTFLSNPKELNLQYSSIWGECQTFSRAKSARK